MLNFAIFNFDALYRGVDAVKPVAPKCKKIRVDEESIMDSLFTVKTVVTSIKIHKSKATNSSQTAAKPQGQSGNMTDTQMVTSQMSTITQLMEQVSILQLAHNKINSKLNKLTSSSWHNLPLPKSLPI